jgi:hypothetical protein
MWGKTLQPLSLYSKMKTPDPILINALYQLVEDIDSMDGIANAVIAEAASRLNELIEGIKVVLNENSHLADGEDCTLIKLKKLIDYEPHN